MSFTLAARSLAFSLARGPPINDHKNTRILTWHMVYYILYTMLGSLCFGGLSLGVPYTDTTYCTL